MRRDLRSPKAAAFAGIVCSVLMLGIMIMTSGVVRSELRDFTGEWLEFWSGTASLVLVLVPFAGIAFLWFTGVMRDRLGDREDRFFATIFFGSGIILGALMGVGTMAGVSPADNDMYVFGFAFMNQIIGNYTLRMAGVCI